MKREKKTEVEEVGEAPGGRSRNTPIREDPPGFSVPVAHFGV
jgi:hypothetical protein